MLHPEATLRWYTTCMFTWLPPDRPYMLEKSPLWQWHVACWTTCASSNICFINTVRVNEHFVNWLKYHLFVYCSSWKLSACILVEAFVLSYGKFTVRNAKECYIKKMGVENRLNFLKKSNGNAIYQAFSSRSFRILPKTDCTPFNFQILCSLSGILSNQFSCSHLSNYHVKLQI